MNDLELLQLIRRALCKLPNQRLNFKEAKDTYALCTMIETRLKNAEETQKVCAN
jgi:hypothetical protein